MVVPHLTLLGSSGSGGTRQTSLISDKVVFGSEKVSKASSTPYSDATQTKKHPPNHIKRPMNSFMVWSQIGRRKICKENPEINNIDISKRLGMEWRLLSEVERKPYRDEADRLRQLHFQEYPNYKYMPKKQSKSGSDSACSLPGPSAKIPRKSTSRKMSTPKKKAKRSKSLACQSLGISSTFETPKKQIISNLNGFSQTSSVSSPGSPPLNRIHIVTSTIKTPPESLTVHFKIDKQFKDSVNSVHKQIGESVIAHLTPPMAKVPESPSSPDSLLSPESASMYEEDSVSSPTDQAPKPPKLILGDTSRRSLYAALEAIPSNIGTRQLQDTTSSPMYSPLPITTETFKIEPLSPTSQHQVDLFSSIPCSDDVMRSDLLDQLLDMETEFKIETHAVPGFNIDLSEDPMDSWRSVWDDHFSGDGF